MELMVRRVSVGDTELLRDMLAEPNPLVVGRPLSCGSCFTAESCGVLKAEVGWADGFSTIVLAEPIA